MPTHCYACEGKNSVKITAVTVLYRIINYCGMDAVQTLCSIFCAVSFQFSLFFLMK